MERIDVELVEAIQRQRMEINEIPFKEIEWYKDGKKLDFPQKILDDFEFTGLSNTDFVITEFYDGGFGQE